MDTFEHDLNLFTRPNAGDEQLFAVFYSGVIKDETQSEEQGRPIFHDVECVRIIIPGDKNSVIDRPATKDDKRRFQKQYALFTEGKKGDEQIVGTLLTEWPAMSRAQCEELKFLGIRTIEQLANVRDDVAGRVPGVTSLKQRAAVYLAQAEKGAEAAKIAKQLNDQTNEIETLRQSVKEQAALIEKLMKGKSHA